MLLLKSSFAPELFIWASPTAKLGRLRLKWCVTRGYAPENIQIRTTGTIRLRDDERVSEALLGPQPWTPCTLR